MEDKLLQTPTSPEVMAKGTETDAYQLAISAYVWGYPLVRMETVAGDTPMCPTPSPDELPCTAQSDWLGDGPCDT